MEGGRADWRLSASSPESETFKVGHVDSDAQAGGIFSLGFHHQQPAHWAACTCLNFHCTPCPLGLGSSLELLSHQDTQFLIFGSWKPFSALASCLLSLCWCDHFLMPLPPLCREAAAFLPAAVFLGAPAISSSCYHIRALYDHRGCFPVNGVNSLLGMQHHCTDLHPCMKD